MQKLGGARHNRFERRIAVATVATATLALLLASIGFIGQNHVLNQRSLQTQRAAVLDLIANDIADDLATGDRAEVQISLQRTRAIEGFRKVRILSVDGQTLAAWPKQRARQAGPSSDISDVIRYPVQFNGRQIATLEVGYSNVSLWSVARQYIGTLLLLLTGTTLFSMAIGILIAKRTARPVASFIDLMSKAAQSGELALYDPSQRDPLFPDLIEAFNRLVLSLHRKDRDLQRSLDVAAQARDEADQANQAKSVFLARMSHEIRTPLNGISAMAQMMSRDELPPAQAERLSIILDSSRHLSVLLEELLDHSRIESGRIALDERAFDLGDTIRSALAGYGQIASEKGIALQASVPTDLEGIWLGDPDRIRQILINLVSNALKFTNSGSIDIALSHSGDGRLALSVRDTGIGIAPDRLAAIFERFQQAGPEVRREFGGSGLGLNIARQLAELMGGSISVASEPGVGSEFILHLPLKRLQATSKVGRPEPQIELAASRPAAPCPLNPRPLILAADDNPINRQVLASILSVFEIDLFQVENGLEAVRQFQSTRFDLVLLDLQMPVLDGLDACRQMRAHERAGGLARTPVLALSASGLPDQLKACRAAGMDGLIAKPIEIDDLIHQISRALRPEIIPPMIELGAEAAASS